MQMPPVTARDIDFAQMRLRREVPWFIAVVFVPVGPFMICVVSVMKVVSLGEGMHVPDRRRRNGSCQQQNCQ